MEIKADEKLFYAWKTLGEEVKNFAAIVQNDMDLTESEIKNWRNICFETKEKFGDLIYKTLEHLGYI